MAINSKLINETVKQYVEKPSDRNLNTTISSCMPMIEMIATSVCIPNPAFDEAECISDLSLNTYQFLKRYARMPRPTGKDNFSGMLYNRLQWKARNFISKQKRYVNKTVDYEGDLENLAGDLGSTGGVNEIFDDFKDLVDTALQIYPEARETIEHLMLFNNNKSAVARALGVSESCVYKYLRKLKTVMKELNGDM